MILLLAIACDRAEDSAPSGTPTWSADVAPIVEKHCVRCHEEGQIAPFALRKYSDAALWASAMAAATEARTMPPFLADNSGDCTTYQDAAWMSDEEIATLRAWADAGAPEGDGGVELKVVEPDTLANPTHSLKIDPVYSPDFEGRDDDYRCFVVDPGLAEEGFLLGFEVVPGDARVVHHVLAYSPQSQAAVDEALALDAQDEAPGYSCFGGAGVDADLVVAWAPGKYVEHYPEGTGIRLPAGRQMILEMHYNNAGVPGATDSTEVKLEVADSVENELYSWFWVNGNLNISPGESAWVEENSVKLQRYIGYDVSLNLLQLSPHMHTIGRQQRAMVEHADGSESCLVDVADWDFNWQLSYRLEDPVTIGPDDKLKLSCTYDSSDRSETTTWGEGTSDEMCLVLMLTTLVE